MKTAKAQNILKEQIAQKQAMLKFLQKHEESFERLDVEPTVFGRNIDLDRLTHEVIVEVIKAFPGHWTKEVSLFDEDKIDYNLYINDSITVRCYAGEPPPNCQIVEKEEFVEEQIIPAHTRKIRTIQCK